MMFDYMCPGGTDVCVVMCQANSAAVQGAAAAAALVGDARSTAASAQAAATSAREEAAVAQSACASLQRALYAANAERDAAARETAELREGLRTARDAAATATTGRTAVSLRLMVLCSRDARDVWCRVCSSLGPWMPCGANWTASATSCWHRGGARPRRQRGLRSWVSCCPPHKPILLQQRYALAVPGRHRRGTVRCVVRPVQARASAATAAAEAAAATAARLRGEIGEDAAAAGDAQRAFVDIQVCAVLVRCIRQPV